jgi:hypothetical protein
MKHFALLNEDNLVINISVADDNWDSTGWVEYTNKECGIGYSYDENLNAFISPKCHDEAVLNTQTLKWECSNSNHDEPMDVEE